MEDMFPASLPETWLESQHDADLNCRLKAELEYASLDFLFECRTSFDEHFYEYLCKNCPNIIIYRFNDLSSIFKKFQNLFSVLFESFRLDLEKSSAVAALDILKQEYLKDNTKYKDQIKTYVADLYQNTEQFGKTLSEENVLKRAPVIESVSSLLHAVKSPQVSNFAEYVNNARELKRKVSAKMVESIKGIFSGLGEIWKSSDSTLLELTHARNSGVSLVSIEPASYQGKDMERCFVDILNGNFPDEGNFPDASYQLYLQRMEDCYSATFLNILSDQSVLDKYSCLVKSAVRDISKAISWQRYSEQPASEQKSQRNDGLSEDIELLLSMLDAVATNMNEPCRKREIACYSTAMYLCSLTEKLLRLFYLYLVTERHVPSDRYVPSDITLGELLNTANQEVTDVFGRSHVRHLACFMLGACGASGTKLGKSYRNSLAQWASGMKPDDMTPNLVSSILWLFTDILNSVSLYLETHTDAGAQAASADRT